MKLIDSLTTLATLGLLSATTVFADIDKTWINGGYFSCPLEGQRCFAMNGRLDGLTYNPAVDQLVSPAEGPVERIPAENFLNGANFVFHRSNATFLHAGAGAKVACDEGCTCSTAPPGFWPTNDQIEAANELLDTGCEEFVDYSMDPYSNVDIMAECYLPSGEPVFGCGDWFISTMEDGTKLSTVDLVLIVVGSTLILCLCFYLCCVEVERKTRPRPGVQDMVLNV